MLNRNAVVSIVLCLVLPAFVVYAVLFAPINPPGVLIAACLLSPLAAAFFGHGARRHIRKSCQDGARGSTLAATGLTIGYLEIVFVALILVSGGHHHPSSAAYEASAVGSMRTLNFATHTYASAHPQGGFPKALKDLSWNGTQPEPDWAIDESLASGVKVHYQFTYVPGSAGADGVIDAYQIFADPVYPNEMKLRHFFTDQTGAIRISSSSQANSSSPELK